MLTLSSY